MSITLPAQQPQPDPRGWLVFSAPLPDDLQRAEDSTQWADFRPVLHTWVLQRDPDTAMFVSYFERPATTTETTILEALGYHVPDDLVTRVSFPASSVRCRRWLQIEAALAQSGEVEKEAS